MLFQKALVIVCCFYLTSCGTISTIYMLKENKACDPQYIYSGTILDLNFPVADIFGLFLLLDLPLSLVADTIILPYTIPMQMKYGNLTKICTDADYFIWKPDSMSGSATDEIVLKHYKIKYEKQRAGSYKEFDYDFHVRHFEEQDLNIKKAFLKTGDKLIESSALTSDRVYQTKDNTYSAHAVWNIDETVINLLGEKFDLILILEVEGKEMEYVISYRKI